jgi:hypothetical protein
MRSPGNRVVTADEGRDDGAGQRRLEESTVAQGRRKTLSYGRVMELVADLMNRRFYGKLALHFEAGHVVCAKLEQSIKE